MPFGWICSLYFIAFFSHIRSIDGILTYFPERFLRFINESSARHFAKFQRSFEFVSQSGQCPELQKQNKEIFGNYLKIRYPVQYRCGPFPEYANLVLAPRNHSQNVLGNCNNNTMNNWNPEAFLSLMKNKSIGIYGDSIARQLFHGLVGALLKYETNHTQFGHTYINHYYRDFQVNISFCDDGQGKLASQEDKSGYTYKLCLQPMMDSADYLILGLAAWFKPFFAIKTEKDYYLNLFFSYRHYQRTLTTIREWIADYPSLSYSSRKNRNPIKVIWRLSPHAANIDELSFLYGKNLSSVYDHGNGLLWSQNFTQYSTNWPDLYNYVQRNISHSYHDLILDWHSLSYSYMEKLEMYIIITGTGPSTEKICRFT
jgi:hypothetical protein